MDIFSGLTWNVRGCNNIKNRRNIKSHIRNNNVNLLCLQETKCSTWDNSKKNSIWDANSHGWIEVPPIGLSGGLLITWDLDLYQHISHSISNNWIVFKGHIKNTETTFIIINVYAPQAAMSKASLWEKLSGVLNSSIDLPICLMGDFNSVTEEADRENCLHSDIDTNIFNSFIENNDLVIIKTIEPRFT